MDIQAEKIELVKKLLDTNDVGIIKAIKSIFISSQHSLDEWADLPDEVILDIKEALQQINLGEGISHVKAKETYKKWL